MRLEGWEALLTGHIVERPFAWGEHDCVLFAADWVLKVTGEDYANDIRGAYATEEGAKELMGKMGYSSVEAIADAHLVSVPVMLARRGDLLLHPQGLLGICTGKEGVFPTKDGVTKHKTLDCPKAWGVG